MTDEQIDPMTEMLYLRRFEAVLTDAITRDTLRRNTHLRTARRPWAVMAAAAALVVVAVVTLTATVDRNPQAAAAIDVIDDGASITILLRDVEADVAEVQRQIRAAGVNVDLTEVAASPSIAGKVRAFYRTEGAPGLEVIERDGKLFHGFRVPKNSIERLELFIARPARGDEPYQVGADAYAPGEILGCSGLYGRRVGDVRAQLEQLGVTINWQRVDADGSVTKATIDEVGDYYVTDASSTSARNLTIYVTTTGRSAFATPSSKPNEYQC